MYKLKLAAFYSLSFAVVFSFSACEDDVLQDQQMASRTTTTENTQELDQGIDNYTDPNGQPVPYPTIIERTFYPNYDLFSEMKCLTWKITWPTYPAGMDPKKIPSVLSLSSGALNSFYYLNNVHPNNTYRANFSLYHNNKLESANSMWLDLIHSYGGGDQMETASFLKSTASAKTIEEWVKVRPQMFKLHYKGQGSAEVDYVQGDIYLFWLQKQQLFGGVRIVSMNPRVIEVYLAVPNI